MAATRTKARRRTVWESSLESSSRSPPAGRTRRSSIWATHRFYLNNVMPPVRLNADAPTSPVPEPATLWLSGVGVAALARRRRLSRRLSM